MVVVLYVHMVSHNLKQVAQRYQVPVVFSAPQKMAQICSKVRLNLDKVSRMKCKKKHATEFVPCTSRVVYSIPLICGGTYVGQAGRCIKGTMK